jgi:hypothetical protein
MQILTSLNDLEEANEILHWLKNHGISVSLEGQLIHTRGSHIPNGLGIYVLNSSQFQEAKHRLSEFDRRFRKPKKGKQTLWDRLQKRKLDKFIIALFTALLAALIIWLTYRLFA